MIDDQITSVVRGDGHGCSAGDGCGFGDGGGDG
jgi:hypothetical protein